MWYNESVFYQIYPLGFCGAPRENDGVTVNRIKKVNDWIEHIKSVGANAIYFSPLFESDRHGYDTRDYKKLDCRLGTNEDFKEVCENLHKNDIKIVLDGVFNHVGRGFWAFKDVQEKKWDSPYKDWFHINFDGNSYYNDGFWYEGWEGHFELVKLNLKNNDVVEYLFSCIDDWVKEFDIDGLRLDVAYCLDMDFLSKLRSHCDSLKSDFFLVGELMHGDYSRYVTDDKLNSCTNYECYKGLYSSFNSSNMFEITHSLMRQFGPEPWTLYRGKPLLNFLDNHDVERIASILTEKAHLRAAWGLLFGMPGVPVIYYGSEWGMEGRKADGDAALRPACAAPQETELTQYIAALARARAQSPALRHGGYRQVLQTNRQLIFERACAGGRVLVAVNADAAPFQAHFDAGVPAGQDLITGETQHFGGAVTLAPHRAYYWHVG